MPKKAKSVSKPGEVETDDYNAVVAKATLRNIRLLSSSYEALPEAFGAGSEDRTNGVGYELLAHRYDRETNRLTGMFAFKTSSSAGEKMILRIEGEYLIDYELSADCEDDAAELFVRRLGPFAAYPYFRALVSLLNGQSGLVRAPLPILAEAPRRIERAKAVRFSGEDEEIAVAETHKTAVKRSGRAAESKTKKKV